MSTDEEELDLLLSLRDRVLETPPGSPSPESAQPSGCFPREGSPLRAAGADDSIFGDAAENRFRDTVHVSHLATKPKLSKIPNAIEVEKFSGLRIRDPLISAAELGRRLSEIRFVRLAAIGNMLLGDTISGCWATVGVLTEKGQPKMSSNGKNFSVWKISCLNESAVSVFLFGDAFSMNSKEQVGAVYALFNSKVQRDSQGKGFSLTMFSASQFLKLGKSADYGICKGKRKDGLACTMVINKCHGIYCKYHSSQASKKYSTFRTELKGGNLRTVFRNHLQPEGIYMVEPPADRTNKHKKPVKVLSVDGLKKVLGNAAKVTTKSQSQGIRFLTEVTGKVQPKDLSKGSVCAKGQKAGSSERLSSTMKLASKIAIENRHPEAKRIKIEPLQASGNLIELDIVSSDEEM